MPCTAARAVDYRAGRAGRLPAPELEPQRGKRWLHSSVVVSIYQTICSIKQEHFVNDVECRCVHLDPDQEEYPVMLDDRQRPFIEMHFDPVEFVKEVWVGAHAYRLECESAIASFVETGRLRCDVKRSAIKV